MVCQGWGTDYQIRVDRCSALILVDGLIQTVVRDAVWAREDVERTKVGQGNLEKSWPHTKLPITSAKKRRLEEPKKHFIFYHYQ